MKRSASRRRLRAAFTIVLALASIGLGSTGVVQSAQGPSPYPGGRWQPPPARYGVGESRFNMVRMDDGLNIRADVFYPTGQVGAPAKGPFPVLLTQTPYSLNLQYRNNIDPAEPYLVSRGWIVVRADQRGTGLSGGGDWEMFGRRQGRDGAALAFWASKLPNSTGEVGLFGCSAMGISQLATAIELGRTYGTHHPVKAMFPGCISGGLYRDTYFDNGIPGMIVPYSTIEPAASTWHTPYNLLEGRVPRLQAEEVMLGLDRAYERGFWSERKWSDNADDIVRSGIPALIYVGWNEGGHIGALEMYAQLQNAFARRDPHGPMANGQPVTGRYQVFIGEGSHGCCLGDRGVHLQWFGHWLKGEDTGLSLDTKTPLHLQVRNDTRYVNLARYPMTDQYTTLRLGPGTLTTTAPEDGTDGLAYGTPIDGLTSHTYESAPYGQGATIAGPMSASIFATSSNTNIQFAAALFDVAPDGTANEITHASLVGSLSDLDLDVARSWRDSSGHIVRPYPRFDFDRYKTPNEVHEYHVNLAPKLYNLPPGHRLRFTLATQWDNEVCADSIGVGPAPYGCFNTAPQLASLAGGRYVVHRTAARPSALHVPLLRYHAFPPVTSRTTPTSGILGVPQDWG